MRALPALFPQELRKASYTDQRLVCARPRSSMVKVAAPLTVEAEEL